VIRNTLLIASFIATFVSVAIGSCVGSRFGERRGDNLDRITRAKAERFAASENKKLPKDSCSRWIAVDHGPSQGWVPYLDESKCEGVLNRDLERLEGGPQR
jgi:hypothetical protein